MGENNDELKSSVDKIPVPEYKKKERELLSVNDVRKKYGLPPLDDPKSDKPLIPINEIK